MVSPATPAEPSREMKIRAKEAAIKRKLAAGNASNKAVANKFVQDQVGKNKGSGKTFTKGYTSKVILGENKGFTKSDYGVGKGAAIPYQIGGAVSKVSATATKPKPKPKPKPSKVSQGYVRHKVKRGDTLSGIGKKYGMDWKDIWDYNLKNRKSSTVKTLKKRGPNLIFRGGTFYIPKR